MLVVNTANASLMTKRKKKEKRKTKKIRFLVIMLIKMIKNENCKCHALKSWSGENTRIQIKTFM